jgi:xanthosine utilization system XapX-like protein
MQFLLGAGSEVVLLTNFVVQVPAPGAIALLGISGLVGRRRRA